MPPPEVPVLPPPVVVEPPLPVPPLPVLAPGAGAPPGGTGLPAWSVAGGAEDGGGVALPCTVPEAWPLGAEPDADGEPAWGSWDLAATPLSARCCQGSRSNCWAVTPPPVTSTIGRTRVTSRRRPPRSARAGTVAALGLALAGTGAGAGTAGGFSSGPARARTAPRPAGVDIACRAAAAIAAASG